MLVLVVILPNIKTSCRAGLVSLFHFCRIYHSFGAPYLSPSMPFSSARPGNKVARLCVWIRWSLCLCCLTVPRPDAFGFSRAVVLPIASFPSPDAKRFAWLVAHWQLWPGLFRVLPPFLLLQRWLSWPGLICQGGEQTWSKNLGFGRCWAAWAECMTPLARLLGRGFDKAKLEPVVDIDCSRSAMVATQFAQPWKPRQLCRGTNWSFLSWRTSAGLLSRVSRSQAP